MSGWKENIEFILVEPAEAGNIGASARAIKNMGFGRLGLVNPPPSLAPEAGWLARGALDVLDEARAYGGLKEALSGKNLVVGTTRRRGRRRGPILPVLEGAVKIADFAVKGRVAILFGREDRGLYNEETEECDFMMTIPTGGAQPSLNLSHAVLIVAYELSKRQQSSSLKVDTLLSVYEERALLYERLEGALDALGYGERGDRDLKKKVFLGIKRLLGRSGLTKQEHKMLLGLCARIEEEVKKRR